MDVVGEDRGKRHPRNSLMRSAATMASSSDGAKGICVSAEAEIASSPGADAGWWTKVFYYLLAIIIRETSVCETAFFEPTT